MLQYLLNMTAIWLLSLLVFDLFLRKETFHSFNRMYLSGTLLLGILLPFWSWHETSVVLSSNISRPAIENAATIKQAIVQSRVVYKSINWQDALLILYAAGVAISFLWLLKDVFKIVGLYRKGSKSKDGVWTIVETGQSHSPFSAFRYVFIRSRSDYEAEELKMILTHEEQHGHALHVVDLLLFQLAKIACWFHPLVYVYYNRLLIVHEYQADKAVDKKPQEYGTFLIEQAILSSAPALSHSFNRSPIKKRIVMLTKKSSRSAQTKRFITVPLLVVCILCFTKNAFSDDKRIKKDNTVTYRGNVVEFKIWQNDTVFVVDPVTGQEMMKIVSREPSPIMLNGEKLYDMDEIDELRKNTPYTQGSKPITKPAVNSLAVKEYLLSNMKDDIRKLKDGEYYIEMDNIIIDKKGNIVYFDYAGIKTAKWGSKEDSTRKLSKTQQDAFAKKVARLMNDAPKHEAGVVNGEEVNVIIDNNIQWNAFEVKGGRVVKL